MVGINLHTHQRGVPLLKLAIIYVKLFPGVFTMGLLYIFGGFPFANWQYMYLFW